MRTEQLKYLVDVAETGSMNKTAERLFVPPQAVSKAIKQLEEELGVELLVRTRMGVSLTGIGDSIVALAENMLMEEQLMGQIVAHSKRERYTERTFPLRIYSTSAIANIILPDSIARFMDANVNIIPRVQMLDSWRYLFDSVQNGDCDLGLLTYNDEALFRSFAPYQEHLDMKLLARDELVAVTKAQMKHADQEALPVQELKKHFFTMFSVLPTDEQRFGEAVVQVARSNDADFHRAMILRTNATTIMPGIAYQYFFGSKRYMARPLEGYHTPLLHVAVYRKDASEELRRFVSLMRIKLM